MFNNIDLLVVGAGPVGCVIAERAANLLNCRVLVVDKRNHIAGNAYDRFHESGVFIHQYGPHYFRTSNQSLYRYLCEFTEWVPGNYIAKSWSRGELFPFPINLLTLEQFFNRSFSVAEAKAFLELTREKIKDPSNSEELILSRVGRELYEAFYQGYTLKQWEIHPRELNSSVCGRIPIRFNKDQRYVDQIFQVTPKLGFTALFSKMITHPKISILLQTDYKEIKQVVRPKFGTVYCGPVDEYFDFSFGKLSWRSLEFDFKEFNQKFKQPCVQINYPNDFEYTRSVEIKHVTGQKHSHTVVSYEYSKSKGDPYYPVPTEENAKLYEKYKEQAEQETRNSKVFFSGRLAQYKYMNLDEAIEGALRTFELLKGGLKPV